jgi:hypothetical protein
MAKKKSSSSVDAHCHPVVESAADKKQRERWQTEDDARTLQRAEEIRKDPARTQRVRRWAREQLANVTALTKA